MDNVELHFRNLDSDQDVSRKYLACTLDDASQKYHLLPELGAKTGKDEKK